MPEGDGLDQMPVDGGGLQAPGFGHRLDAALFPEKIQAGLLRAGQGLRRRLRLLNARRGSVRDVVRSAVF